MYLNADQLPHETLLQNYDLCIVGAGAAMTATTTGAATTAGTTTGSHVFGAAVRIGAMKTMTTGITTATITITTRKTGIITPIPSFRFH